MQVIEKPRNDSGRALMLAEHPDRLTAYNHLLNIRCKRPVEIMGVEVLGFHICGAENLHYGRRSIIEFRDRVDGHNFITVIDDDRSLVAFEITSLHRPQANRDSVSCWCGQHRYVGDREELSDMRRLIRFSVLDVRIASGPLGGPLLNVDGAAAYFRRSTSTMAGELRKQPFSDAIINKVAPEVIGMLFYSFGFEEFMKHPPIMWNDWKSLPENAPRERHALVFVEEVWKPIVTRGEADFTFFRNYDEAGAAALQSKINYKRRMSAKRPSPGDLFRSWLPLPK